MVVIQPRSDQLAPGAPCGIASGRAQIAQPGKTVQIRDPTRLDSDRRPKRCGIGDPSPGKFENTIDKANTGRGISGPRIRRVDGQAGGGDADQEIAVEGQGEEDPGEDHLLRRCHDGGAPKCEVVEQPESEQRVSSCCLAPFLPLNESVKNEQARRYDERCQRETEWIDW